ncbi:MAG TPA: hypothetical protein VIX19_17410 [Terriglobales bacterium]
MKLLVALFMLAAIVTTPCQGAVQKPLTSGQIDALVAGGVDSQRIVQAVRQRGIDFQPTVHCGGLVHKGGAVSP